MKLNIYPRSYMFRLIPESFRLKRSFSNNLARTLLFEHSCSNNLESFKMASACAAVIPDVLYSNKRTGQDDTGINPDVILHLVELKHSTDSIMSAMSHATANDPCTITRAELVDNIDRFVKKARSDDMFFDDFCVLCFHFCAHFNSVFGEPIYGFKLTCIAFNALNGDAIQCNIFDFLDRMEKASQLPDKRLSRQNIFDAHEAGGSNSEDLYSLCIVAMGFGFLVGDQITIARREGHIIDGISSVGSHRTMGGVLSFVVAVGLLCAKYK